MALLGLAPLSSLLFCGPVGQLVAGGSRVASLVSGSRQVSRSLGTSFGVADLHVEVSGFKKAARDGKPQNTSIFQIFAYVVFAAVPLTKAGIQPASESMWEGTLQGQGYSKGNHCPHFGKQSATKIE